MVGRICSALVLGLAVVWLAGCAAQQLVRQGDTLLRQEQHAEALERYEEALKLDPDHAGAKEGVRNAHRLAVRKEIARAEAALQKGSNAMALRLAVQARRMPLDLEAVDLVRRIEQVINSAVARAEERVAKLLEDGLFLPALNIAEKVLEAAPGSPRRQAWVQELQGKAVQHHLAAAEQYAKDGLPGASAMQLAFAGRAGAEVAAQRVERLWSRFAEPTCFAKPVTQVVDASKQAGKLLPRLELTAQNELNALRAQCGEGVQPLTVKIALDVVNIVDEEKKQRAAKPLPGHRVETEEIYWVEEPYTVVEEVTEYETRKELVERRDCAPRPGKQRGCVTWTEEVEKQVPITRKKEIEKMRRVQRTRPISGPLPEDKVVTYELTTILRKVEAKGTVAVRRHPNEAAQVRSFNVRFVSEDSGHPEVRGGGGPHALVIPEDPLEAKPMHQVLADAAVGISEEVRTAVREAVDVWTSTYRKDAADYVLKGQMPQAEELYLKMLALGAHDDADLQQFFQRRYGEPVERVMQALAVSLGHEVKSEQRAESASTPSGRASLLPRRPEPSGGVETQQEKEVPAEQPAEPTVTGDATPAGGKATEGFSDEELDALEAASFDATKPRTPPEPRAAPADEGQPAEGASDDAAAAKSSGQ